MRNSDTCGCLNFQPDNASYCKLCGWREDLHPAEIEKKSLGQLSTIPDADLRAELRRRWPPGDLKWLVKLATDADLLAELKRPEREAVLKAAWSAHSKIADKRVE